MGKLEESAKQSKLGKRKNSTSKTKKISLAAPSKASNNPTSIRLTSDDRAIFNRIVKELNGVSKSKVSESDTMRALVRFSENIAIDRIYKAYKDGL